MGGGNAGGDFDFNPMVTVPLNNTNVAKKALSSKGLSSATGGTGSLLNLANAPAFQIGVKVPDLLGGLTQISSQQQLQQPAAATTSAALSDNMGPLDSEKVARVVISPGGTKRKLSPNRAMQETVSRFEGVVPNVSSGSSTEQQQGTKSQHWFTWGGSTTAAKDGTAGSTAVKKVTVKETNRAPTQQDLDDIRDIPWAGDTGEVLTPQSKKREMSKKCLMRITVLWRA